MGFSRFMKVVTVVSCLSAASVFTAWASSPPLSGKDVQGLIGDQAVISMVKQDQVTLKSLNGESRQITLTMNNAKEFKIGDKVNVQGNMVQKQDAASSNNSKPVPGAHPGAAGAK